MAQSEKKIRVLIVDDIAETRENIKRMLSFEQTIEVIGTARTGREAIEQATAIRPDVIIMDINMPDMDGISATTEIKKKLPYVMVVILSVQSDPSYMRRAMLAGARDFLTKPPMIDELTDAIKRAGAVAHEEQKKSQSAYATPMDGGAPVQVQQAAPRGKVITVYSPKGGSGRTTIATNLSIALKEEGKTALIDGSLQFGDVAVFLNEQGKNTILDLAPRVSELDPDIVQEVMLTHKGSGIDILAAPSQPDLAVFGKVTGEQFGTLLDYLRRLYSHIVVDTAVALDFIWGAAMEASSVIVLVVTQDIPSIKNTSAFLKMAESEGIKRDKFLVVMNKYDRKINIAPERVSEILRQPVSLTIPFDDKIVGSAIIRGTPFMVDQKAQPIAKSIQTLAEMVRDKIVKLETVEVPTTNAKK
jgi:pilus assembly protein CpaE